MSSVSTLQVNVVITDAQEQNTDDLLCFPPQLFKDDIMYLLTMDKLWKKRKAPIPLDWQQLANSGKPTCLYAS